MKSLSMEDSSNSDTTCEAQNLQTFEINAGCLMFSVPNTYDEVDAVVGGSTDHIFEYLGGGGGISDNFMASFEAHREIWNCFPKTSLGQVGDPDLQCVWEWSRKYWMGMSYSAPRRGKGCPSTRVEDVRAGTWWASSWGDAHVAEGKETTDAHLEALRPYAIKLFFSLFSMTCLMKSADIPADDGWWTDDHALGGYKYRQAVEDQAYVQTYEATM